MLISLGRIGGPDARKRLLARARRRPPPGPRVRGARARECPGRPTSRPRLRKEFEAASDDSLKGAAGDRARHHARPRGAQARRGSRAGRRTTPSCSSTSCGSSRSTAAAASAAVVEQVARRGEGRPTCTRPRAIALGLIGSLDSQTVLIKHLTSAGPVTLRAARGDRPRAHGRPPRQSPRSSRSIRTLSEQQIVRARRRHGARNPVPAQPVAAVRAGLDRLELRHRQRRDRLHQGAALRRGFARVAAACRRRIASARPAAAQNQVATQDIWALDFHDGEDPHLQRRAGSPSARRSRSPGPDRRAGSDSTTPASRTSRAGRTSGPTTASRRPSSRRRLDGIDQAQDVAVRPGTGQEVWVACGTIGHEQQDHQVQQHGHGAPDPDAAR